MPRALPTVRLATNARHYDIILGTALVKLCDTNKRVISLDGDMKNSTFSEKVHKKYPEQFVECFIAEQNVSFRKFAEV